ncbi:N4-gp56 family major capsid protein [bacterium]|jgi:N4-gp56 family major capsid protein|nr:N4-gp56 family major capsid protein [bacterium]
MPVTTSTTLTSQFQNYFSKELLSIVQQETILDQFGMKAPIPKNNGNKAISMFRFGAPSIGSVQTISSEGTPISSANYRALALNSLSKSLSQYGQVIGLTDILRATDLFNSLQQSTKTSGLDMALWVDSVIRNVLIGSNLTASGSSIGSAAEGGGTFDNSDACGTAAASGGTCVYGNPATLTTQTFAGLNADTTAANTTMTASAVLDSMTRLKRNRAPMINGGYVLATDPRVARDLMRDSDWLNASNYGNKGTPFYKGEVGSIYGCRVVTQTNSFVSTGSATENDKFVYQATAAGGGLTTGKDIIASFFFGNEAFGIPALTGDDPLSPKIVITDTPDKSDPLNQLVTVGVKIYFAALRLAAGNTGSTGNPTWYLVHRTKTSTTL